MKLTFLGTGTSTGVPVPTCGCRVCCSSDPRDQRLRPSILVEWDGAAVLIDTSTDLREQALRFKIERIDAVLYTHSHADHILGLDDLRLYNWRQGGAVPAYGNAATLGALSRTFWYVFSDESAEHTRPLIDRREVTGPFELANRTVRPIPIRHGTLEILAYRIGAFAYVTDANRIPESSYSLLSGLDVLVLNALRERPHPTHFCLSESLAEAKRIGARQTYFSHISHEIGHSGISSTLPEGVALAWDGLVLELDEANW